MWNHYFSVHRMLQCGNHGIILPLEENFVKTACSTKCVDITEFFHKMVRVNLHNFHTVCWLKIEIQNLIQIPMSDVSF